MEDLVDFTINLTKYSNKNQVDESKSGYLPPVERTDWLEQYAEMTYSDQQEGSSIGKDQTILFFPPGNAHLLNRDSNSLSSVEVISPERGLAIQNELGNKHRNEEIEERQSS